MTVMSMSITPTVVYVFNFPVCSGVNVVVANGATSFIVSVSLPELYSHLSVKVVFALFTRIYWHYIGS